MGDVNLVQAVLADYHTAPLSHEQMALFRLLEKVVADSSSVSQGDVDEAKAAGCTDDMLYVAFTVVSLFQFYNCWIDANGVHDLPDTAYDTMAKRMATDGYAKE